MSLLASRSRSDVVVCRPAPRDVPAVAHALADAFFDDPVARWFAPRPDARPRQLERFFEQVSLRRMALPHDTVDTTPDIAGAAVWMPPGSLETGALDELRLLPSLVRATGRDVVRVLRAMAAMDAVHPHEPHWYLALLGVVPARQGTGVGSALLRPALRRCDADGLPAYLEATSPRNRSLYERHGFETIGILSLPDGGPSLWRMWREPQRPTDA